MPAQTYFTVLPGTGRLPTDARNRAFLVTDDWDDWFEFSTQYRLIVVDSTGEKHKIGDVKIGQIGMEEGQRRPDIPKQFHSLDERFFSLGQDDSYYEALNHLGPDLRGAILQSLRDIAADSELFERVLSERVTEVSLLRFVSPVTVRGQFHRMARGDARLTEYSIMYRGATPRASGAPPFILEFEVEPDSQPPTNIHVLIGRNGVGKTYLMNSMVRALVDPNADEQSGDFVSPDEDGVVEVPFASIVLVAFSAFDLSDSLRSLKGENSETRYFYIGLQENHGAETEGWRPKTPLQLATEFVNSVNAFRSEARIARWRRALEVLESDPLFREADVTSLTDQEDHAGWDERAFALFHSLSSGHKIVLLTMTRLVETVEERTLVLLDEPEAHLHPPLLSAFIRALSDLLIQRNGVAVIATHSPVVLQEVPKRCAWKLRRSGGEVRADRPQTETFGENVGVLTREVFGLEVTESGFHRMLREAVENDEDYDSVLQRFGNELGGEARAIVRALIAERDSQQAFEN